MSVEQPWVQGRVVHLEAALPEQLLDVTVAQGIAQIPRDGLQDQCRLEVPALVMRRTASLGSIPQASSLTESRSRALGGWAKS
jgi:hypothetical protein